MKKLITFIILITASTCCDFDNPIMVMNLEVLDSSAGSPGAAISAGGWKSIKTPFITRSPYAGEPGFHYVWLRGGFSIPADPEDYYGIDLGRVYHLDHVYINNRLINKTRYSRFANIYSTREYSVPQGVLKEGENTIYVKLGIYSGMFGGLFNDVRILREDDFRSVQLLNDLLYRIIPLGVALFLIISIIVCVIYFSWNPGELIFICGILTSLSTLIYILSIYSPYNLFSIKTSAFIQMLYAPVLLVTGFYASQSLFRVYFPMKNRIMGAVLIIFAILLFLIFDKRSGPAVFIVMLILFVLMITANYFYIIYLIYRAKPDKFNSRFLYLISLVLGFSVIAETFIHFTGAVFPRVLVTYIMPFAIIAFVVFIVRDTAEKNLEMEMLYQRLRDSDNGSSGLPDQSASVSGNGGHDRSTITGASEQKLKKIIDFIEANYMYDISREGLASAVGMNPNYMSTLFRSYTGMSINQYIYKIRIEDAMGRLKDRDKKVIDIALSVGFESLSTFNRAFKSFMNQTPTEYRANTGAP